MPGTGYQSQAGHVIFRTQADKGTFLDPGAGGVAMRTKSGSLGGVRELMIPDPEIGGGRDIPDALLGPVAYSGQYDFYLRLNSFATLLAASLGSVVSTPDSPAAGANSHVIEPIDGVHDLPWLSIEEKIGDGLDGFHFTDARVNTLHVEADAKGYAQGTVGLVALFGRAVGASVTAEPAFDTTPLIVGSKVTVSFGGEDLRGKSFKLDINNNMEEDDFRLGSLTLGDAIPKRREITIGTTVRPTSRDLWRRAMYGDPDSDEPGGIVLKDNVTITFQSYEVIGATAVVYSLSIELGVCAIKPFEQKPSGSDVIQFDLEIQALRPDPAEVVMSCTIVNGLDAVA